MTFKPYLDQFVIVLMYCKKNKEKHDEHLAIVLREHKLYVKFEKLDLWVTKVQFLGIVTKEDICIEVGKVETTIK